MKPKTSCFILNRFCFNEIVKFKILSFFPNEYPWSERERESEIEKKKLIKRQKKEILPDVTKTDSVWSFSKRLRQLVRRTMHLTRPKHAPRSLMQNLTESAANSIWDRKCRLYKKTIVRSIRVYTSWAVFFISCLNIFSQTPIKIILFNRCIL